LVTGLIGLGAFGVPFVYLAVVGEDHSIILWGIPALLTGCVPFPPAVELRG
jgi:hypothetical protein